MRNKNQVDKQRCEYSLIWWWWGEWLQ